jgi:hypothetical protein|tara:strand:- start:351 stop:539 length:189 start_codon:yes stop_codon:yes gene_type:complete
MHIVEPKHCPFCKKRIGVVVDFDVKEITRADPDISLRMYDIKDIKEELAKESPEIFNEKKDN